MPQRRCLNAAASAPPPDGFAPPGGRAPVCRNISIAGRRTSIRMEPVMWLSLHEICEREGLSVNEVCALIDRRRGEAGLTAALRVFIISYFRELMRQSGVRPSARLAPGARRPTGDRPADDRPLLTAALGVFGPPPG